jgi:hypothetical protein
VVSFLFLLFGREVEEQGRKLSSCSFSGCRPSGGGKRDFLFLGFNSVEIKEEF